MAATRYVNLERVINYPLLPLIRVFNFCAIITKYLAEEQAEETTTDRELFAILFSRHV